VGVFLRPKRLKFEAEGIKEFLERGNFQQDRSQPVRGSGGAMQASLTKLRVKPKSHIDF